MHDQRTMTGKSTKRKKRAGNKHKGSDSSLGSSPEVKKANIATEVYSLPPTTVKQPLEKENIMANSSLTTTASLKTESHNILADNCDSEPKSINDRYMATNEVYANGLARNLNECQ